MKLNRIMFAISIIGLAALILMLTLTSPTEIGPLGVLLFFTTLYITIFSVVVLIFRIFLKMAYGRRALKGKEYLYSAVFSFGPIMLLMARSFSVITPWTVGLVVMFLALAEFLVYKRVGSE